MREYIAEYGSVTADEAVAVVKKYDGTIFAVYSDHFLCGNVLDEDITHLMELRIFNEDGEFKLSRYDLGSNFRWRYISDEKFKEKLCNISDSFLSDIQNRIFDEIQYLDIDRKKSDKKSYVTTGGGVYQLPVENAERIMIRNYLDYDDNGILAVNDFRIVKILRKEEK